MTIPHTQNNPCLTRETGGKSLFATGMYPILPDPTNPAWPDQVSSSLGDIHTEPAVGMIQVTGFLFSIFPWCWSRNTKCLP